ncbi:hypothetical protein FJT64_003561 [Amphibalanus amphitrite]|uniref:Uncharacterized protein n=1 Tax=Amphibalanus amphitrite TaxID=1232801 RepID=A0A6A4W5Z0_AMPAM|nr:hypothetical protein FJT64_003561 [Amphibalanus amphitrite]
MGTLDHSSAYCSRLLVAVRPAVARPARLCGRRVPSPVRAAVVASAASLHGLVTAVVQLVPRVAPGSMSVSAPASWSKSQNPYRTAPARRHRRHLVSLRDVRSQTPCLGERSGLAALAAAPVTTAASPPSTATTPLCRRARELSDIDPKYVSQSAGLC